MRSNKVRFNENDPVFMVKVGQKQFFDKKRLEQSRQTLIYSNWKSRKEHRKHYTGYK